MMDDLLPVLMAIVVWRIVLGTVLGIAATVHSFSAPSPA
jgi:hypothetical protein